MKPDRDCLLISRAIDGDATAVEWDELTTLAEHDPQLWRRLGETLRDHTGFARGINAAVAVADSIEPEVGVRPSRNAGPPPVTTVVGRIGSWSGWALAAAVAIAWTIGMNPAPPKRPGDAAVSTAGLIDTAAASELLAAYLDKGRQENLVIGEVPQRVLLETRPALTGGGYEVVYVRQIVERTTVPDLYEYSAEDELGRPMLVRYEPPPRSFH